MTKTVEQTALKFIDENHLIQKGDKVLVALSGGADSVFLLHFLVKFKNRFKIDVAAFHLNHKLRGKSAAADEKFCSEFCSKNKIKLVCVSKDVNVYAKRMKISIEEAGREIRYIELSKAAKKIDCNKIATAHNASDNVETILLNFIKGTGIKGLSGIPFRRENIIRPILCLSSDEIRGYLKHNNIPFRIDKSNLDSDYERNFLRNDIIPKLKARLNPRLEEKINNTSIILSEINSYIDNQIEVITKKVVNFNGTSVLIELKPILKLDKSFLGIFLKTVIQNKFCIELNSENIFSLVDLLSSQTGNAIHLKEDIIASKERGELVIGKRTSAKDKKISRKIKIGEQVKVNDKLISISKVNRKMFKFNRNKSIEFISGDGFRNAFEVRKWKTGDKFQPIGMNGRKNVSDFLADQKILSFNKSKQLVLINDKNIVWVIGLRIDDRFKVTKETKSILKLTVTEK